MPQLPTHMCCFFYNNNNGYCILELAGFTWSSLRHSQPTYLTSSYYPCTGQSHQGQQSVFLSWDIRLNFFHIFPSSIHKQNSLRETNIGRLEKTEQCPFVQAQQMNIDNINRNIIKLTPTLNIKTSLYALTGLIEWIN